MELGKVKCSRLGVGGGCEELRRGVLRGGTVTRLRPARWEYPQPCARTFAAGLVSPAPDPVSPSSVLGRAVAPGMKARCWSH